MNARLGAAGYSRPWRAVAGRCMLGSVADEQDTHVAPITRTQAGRHRRTGGAGQHVQFDGRVSAKPPPLLAIAIVRIDRGAEPLTGSFRAVGR